MANKFTKIFTLVMAISAPLVALGARLDDDDALRIARNFTQRHEARAAEAQPAKIVARSAAGNCVIVAVGPQRRIIVSSDSRTIPVLGWFDSHSSSMESLPDGLRYLLDCYDAEIASAASGMMAPQKNAAIEPIEPLLGDIAWDQGDPYNLMCPKYFGSTLSAVGCAATAMAQVLFYHKWPEAGNGVVTYDCSTLEKTLSADLSKSIYRWDVMTDKYDSRSSEESRQAVALLCRDVGYSIHMEYGEQSGALPIMQPVALINNFNYDPDIQLHYRKYYSGSDWDMLMVRELQEKRPVLFTGFSAAGGHAFVIDGYQDGYFHVNWGWSGTSNGYFLSSALSPSVQGIGGSSGGFNANQVIVTGVRPVGVKAGFLQMPEIVSHEAVRCISSDIDPKAPVADFRLGGKIENVGWKDETVDFALAFYDGEGNEKMLVKGDENVALPQGKFKIGLNFKGVDLSSLQQGKYRVEVKMAPAASGEWSAVRPYATRVPNFLYMTIGADEISFSEVDPSGVKATSLELRSQLLRAITAEAVATISNNSDREYDGRLRIALFNEDLSACAEKGEEMIVTVAPAEEKVMAFHDAFSAPAGKYKLALLDETEQIISTPLDVTLQENPGGHSLLIAKSQLTMFDPEHVGKDSLAFSAEIQATQYPFGGHILVYILDGDETVKGCLTPHYAFIEKDQTKKIGFKGSLENGIPGHEYTAALINGVTMTYISPRDLASYTFRLPGLSELENLNEDSVCIGVADGEAVISASGQWINAEAFRADGTRVACDDGLTSVSLNLPAPGIYVIKVSTPAATSVRKIQIR